MSETTISITSGDAAIIDDGDQTSSNTSERSSSSYADFVGGFGDTIRDLNSDGNLSDNDVKVAQMYRDLVSDFRSSDMDDGAFSSEDGSSTDESSGRKAQEYLSKLNDAVGDSEEFDFGERDTLWEGKRLANGTPEQQAEYLRRTEDALEDGNISGRESKELKSFADGVLSNDTEGFEGTDGADSPSFMEQVEAKIAEADNGRKNRGERLALDAAKIVDGLPGDDQKAFLDELDKMVNTGNSRTKDINEKSEGEGAQLMNWAEGMREFRNENGDTSSTSESAESSDANDRIVAFLRGALDNDNISSSERSQLLALIEATPEEVHA
jgi:hypothetical protein